MGEGEGWCHWGGQGVQVMIGFHFVLLYKCLNIREISVIDSSFIIVILVFFFLGGGGASGKLI